MIVEQVFEAAAKKLVLLASNGRLRQQTLRGVRFVFQGLVQLERAPVFHRGSPQKFELVPLIGAQTSGRRHRRRHMTLANSTQVSDVAE